MGKERRQTVVEALQKLEHKEYSALELAEECLSAIDKNETAVGAYLEVFDSLRENAKVSDEKRQKGEGGVLCGIPLAIKDNILMKGNLSTAGSKMLEQYRAPFNATVIEKLNDAGAVIVGRTNLDEFAMGSSTENSAFGTTKNPIDFSRVPGGSSGGSAAAVAYGGALAALGSDTGGSIRQPASFCGIVGLKPTYGSVSRYGLTAMGSSLDVIGPLTQSVADAELLYRVIMGKDPHDATSLDCRVEEKSVRTIGVPRHFLEEGVDSDVLKHFDNALESLRNAGYVIKDIVLPNIKYALAAYYIVMPAEASTNLSRFDGVKYGYHEEGKTLLEDYMLSRGLGFGKEVKRRILVGTYVLSSGYYDAYYIKAQALRSALREDFMQAFSDVDVMMTPTTPTPAFRFGEKNAPLSMYLADIFTVPSNLTGMPALSVPMGDVEREGSMLPVGLQIMAPHCGEGELFTVGKDVEKFVRV